MQEDNSLWPQPDRVGRLELKMVVDDEHCHVQHRRLVLSRCESDGRPRGGAAILLVQDLKCSIFSLIGLQLKIIGLQLQIIYIYIQGVTGGTDQTSGGCSLC
jgi:protein mago nashi